MIYFITKGHVYGSSFTMSHDNFIIYVFLVFKHLINFVTKSFFLCPQKRFSGECEFLFANKFFSSGPLEVRFMMWKQILFKYPSCLGNMIQIEKYSLKRFFTMKLNSPMKCSILSHAAHVSWTWTFYISSYLTLWAHRFHLTFSPFAYRSTSP